MDANTDKKRTSDARKKATNKYMGRFERVNLLLPLGTKERIKTKYGDISLNDYIKKLVLNDLLDN